MQGEDPGGDVLGALAFDAVADVSECGTRRRQQGAARQVRIDRLAVDVEHEVEGISPEDPEGAGEVARSVTCARVAPVDHSDEARRLTIHENVHRDQIVMSQTGSRCPRHLRMRLSLHEVHQPEVEAVTQERTVLLQLRGQLRQALLWPVPLEVVVQLQTSQLLASDAVQLRQQLAELSSHGRNVLDRRFEQERGLALELPVPGERVGEAMIRLSEEAVARHRERQAIADAIQDPLLSREPGQDLLALGESQDPGAADLVDMEVPSLIEELHGQIRQLRKLRRNQLLDQGDVQVSVASPGVSIGHATTIADCARPSLPNVSLASAYHLVTHAVLLTR